jgi:hypothetical protein
VRRHDDTGTETAAGVRDGARADKGWAFESGGGDVRDRQQRGDARGKAEQGAVHLVLQETLAARTSGMKGPKKEFNLGFFFDSPTFYPSTRSSCLQLAYA